jgi:hypothetical protein
MALPADVIGNILVYACESPKDAAARRWCLGKAWLEAHGARALWRTLTLSTLPVGDAHCVMSAWARAPQQLRRAVERHTREVVVKDSRGVLSKHSMHAPYNFGRGLAGQQFARLHTVRLEVFSTNTTQSYEDDEAALRPLFGAECLDLGELSDDGSRAFLCGGSSYKLLRNFTQLRRLWIVSGPTLFVKPDTTSLWRALVALDGVPADRAERLSYLHRERARRLTELRTLRVEDFLEDVPANFFPHMVHIELEGYESSMPSLATAFAVVGAACPSLRVLSLTIADSVGLGWERKENYSVFAHAPPSLTALVLIMDEVPAPCAESSSLVSLISGHLPAGVHIHLIAHNVVEDDRLLPKGPWEGTHPPFPVNCDDAALAQDTFTKW